MSVHVCLNEEKVIFSITGYDDGFEDKPELVTDDVWNVFTLAT